MYTVPQGLQTVLQKEGGYRPAARKLGIPVRTLWRVFNDPEYEPKRSDIRRKLGLPEIVSIPIHRGKNGRFEPIEQENEP